MTLLSSHLTFPSCSNSASSTAPHLPTALPPPGSHLLITDSVQSPAEFAVGHVLVAARKKGHKVVLVDFDAKGYKHWQALGRRLGVPLSASSTTSTSEFTHIQPSSLPPMSSSNPTTPCLFTQTDEPTLRETYESVTSHLHATGSSDNTVVDQAPVDGVGSVVVLDGLSTLCEMGFEGKQVEMFVRGLMGWVSKTSSILVTRLHASHLDSPTLSASSSVSTPYSSADLFERLIRLGNGWWWRVGMLGSGRSGVVMGEISAHALLPLPTSATTGALSGQATRIPRHNPLQYRVHESGVEVFAKGTGKGFL